MTALFPPTPSIGTSADTHSTVVVAPRKAGPLTSKVGAAFDLEGTTVDLERFRHGGHLQAAAKLGIQLSRDEAVLEVEHFIGGPDEMVAADLHALSSSPLPKIEFVERFLAFTKESFEAQVQREVISPRAGVVEFIDWLRGRDIPFSIGSLTARDQAFSIIKRTGLDLVFGAQQVLVREDVINVKPAPDVYLETAEIMRISPARQIVFEDSPRGVVAAIAAGSLPIGMPVILQDSTLRALEDAKASRIFTDWRDASLREYVGKLVEKLGER